MVGYQMEVCGRSDPLQKIENNNKFLPQPRCLPCSSKQANCVFVADDSFALKAYLMKAYPKAGLNELERVYNYMHSRARRISENMFGIIANRWRVFQSIIFLSPKTIEIIMFRTLILYNFLRKSDSKNIYFKPSLVDTNSRIGDVIPGQWRNEQPP